MATFEEQCALVSEKFIDSRDRSSADPAIVEIFDRFDMAGPLAAALVAGDVQLETDRPTGWIAEAYLALIKLQTSKPEDPSLESSSSGNKNGFAGLFRKKEEVNSGVTSQEAARENAQDETYDSQQDQTQIDEMEEIVGIYQRGNIDEALEKGHLQLEKLKSAENVDLYAAYNLGFRIHDDEFRSVEAEAFCRKAFEFVCSFNHVIGASATNTFVYSFLIPEGNIEEAESRLRTTISRNFGFESLNSLSNLGQILFRKKDFFKAEAIFSRVRMSNIGHMRPEANYWLGRIYSETGRTEQALKIWQEVSKVSRDSYRTMADECLSGNIPVVEWIPGHVETSFAVSEFMADHSVPTSVPDLESAKSILKARFPGVKFDLPARARNFDEVADGIGDIAGFLRCLDQSDFNQSSTEQNHWSALLDYFQYYDALDEHVVLYVGELATRAINLGSWQDAELLARTHFVLGNLELCLAAWKVAHSLEGNLENPLASITSKYPVISLYAHLTRCDRGGLAREIAQEAEISETDVISYLENSIFEREGSWEKALQAIEKFSTSNAQITELGKAVVLIRDQEWKEVRDYLWSLDSQRLELGDESNNGLDGEMIRLNCLMHKCGHELAPSHTWTSGIDLLSAALVDAYYSRWDKFSSNLAEAKEISPEHSSLVAIIFNKLSGFMPLSSMAEDENLPQAIYQLISDLDSVELSIALAQNVAAKELVAKRNPKTFAIISGTASRDEINLALDSKDPELALLVAQNCELDSKMISQLAAYENEKILRLILQSKNCTTEIAVNLLGRLSNDTCWELAGNADTSSAVLEFMAKHEAESVRRAVAKNPNTPAPIFDLLAGDPSWTVRDAVKNNENAPETARAIALLME